MDVNAIPIPLVSGCDADTVRINYVIQILLNVSLLCSNCHSIISWIFELKCVHVQSVFDEQAYFAIICPEV